ncbi:MAG: hypothetical protein IPN76_17335 [Saprospiraceae bacterium]|nr:hypothetical protein [Saprospiraceae bacterium]
MFKSNLAAVVALVLGLLGCEKDISSQLLPKEIAPPPVMVLPICDDTSAFKTSYDLEPFDHIQDCFLATAVKEVPGLGTADWTFNTLSTIGLNGDIMGLRFDTYADYGFPNVFQRELITLGIPLEQGFHIINSSYYGRVTADGDVGQAAWDLDTTCISFVEILQLDLECREVRGNFELHFRLDGQNTSAPHSERVNFINGKFEARIKDFF